MQYFQFDKDGNMFVFEPGAGFSGNCQVVKPGEDLIFCNDVTTTEFSQETSQSQIDSTFASDDGFDSQVSTRL